MKRHTIVASSAALGLMLSASSAHAYTAYDNDALKLSVIGLGEGGFESTSAVAAGENGTEPYLWLALLGAKASYEDVVVGGVLYQFAKGRADLLDAYLKVKPTSFLSFQAGRFKTPVSLEFNIPAGSLVFHRRASLSKIVPLRASGLNANASYTLGGVKLGLDLGGWLGNGVDLDSGVDTGVMATARASAAFPIGLRLHAAVADHFFSSQSVMHDDATHQEAVLDLAAAWAQGGWSAHAEGAVVLSEQEGPRPYGLYGYVAHKWDLGEWPDIEPAVAYDQIRTGDAVGHFGTVAVNAYFMGNDLVASVDYQGGRQAGETSHTGFARLQLGF